MFSPQDRVNNTPDISSSAARAIVQQIRLERVLHRFGYFACSKNLTGRVSPPIVSTQKQPKPTRYDDWFTRPNLVKHTARRHHDVLGACDVARAVRSPRSKIPGAPADNPYMQRAKVTVDGNTFGGINLTKRDIQPKVHNPTLFKPFYSQKSPRRVPPLHTEKPTEPDSDLFKIKQDELVKHIDLVKREKRKQLPVISPLEKPVARNKKLVKIKKEMEFQQWEHDHARYFNRTPKLYSGNDLSVAGEIERACRQTARADEEAYRKKISASIKHGVKKRVNSFGDPLKLPTVYMTFDTSGAYVQM